MYTNNTNQPQDRYSGGGRGNEQKLHTQPRATYKAYKSGTGPNRRDDTNSGESDFDLSGPANTGHELPRMTPGTLATMTTRISKYTVDIPMRLVHLRKFVAVTRMQAHTQRDVEEAIHVATGHVNNAQKFAKGAQQKDWKHYAAKQLRGVLEIHASRV